jgi:glyoxylase-like metal-dependent hydrolase (beta-lactamase superfamily II)
MIFKQFLHEPQCQASYLVGCRRTGEAFVFDPNRELGPDFYSREAEGIDLRVVGVFETHAHADYFSCAWELAVAEGCPLFLHSDTPTVYPFTAIEDGEILELGQIRIEVIHTPGHTPEHVAFLVTDVTRGDEPWAVLTGDSLLVGDVGRPDLLVGDQAADAMEISERARIQFETIRDRLFTLPDHVEVYPGHFGDSNCGGVNMSCKASSTIYFEKRFNLPMQRPNGEIFAEFVRDTTKELPADYQHIKAVNLGLETT